MKIGITGTSGFVGGCISRNLSSNNFIIKEVDRNNLYNNDLQFVLSGVDVLIHSAGLAHDLKASKSISEYYKVNTDLTIQLYDIFTKSNISCFIFISSIKAVIDQSDQEINELMEPNPLTHYGKSKLAAENYILKNIDLTNKRIFILRPSMIYGEGNKGNFNVLYKYIQSGLPWPLGNYQNKRTFCSIDNLNFVIKELIENKNIKNGIYNVVDDESLDINEVVRIISDSINRKIRILKIPKYVIRLLALIGDYIPFLVNSEKLDKLTQNYIISNSKIKNAINNDLPIKTNFGIRQIYGKHNIK